MLHHFFASLLNLLSLADVSHALPFLLATVPVAVPSAGGSDGGDADDEGDGGSSADLSFEAVGKEILSGLSDEEKNRPFGAATADDDDDEGEGGESPYREEDAGAAPKPKPKAKADDKGESAATDADDDDDAEDLEGRAPVDEVKADDDETDDKKEGEEGEGEAIRVTLPGLSERGEEDFEIEVDSPEVAERLRRLKNDGIRAREYGERRAELESREADIERYRDAVEHDPIAFHLEQMTVDKQLEVARALILEHLDVLQPEIDKLIEDPTARKDAQIKLRDKMRESARQLEQNRAVRTHVKKCMMAVDRLIPEGTDSETAAEFVNDARQILAAASRGGQRVTPQSIPQLIAKRLKLYGFDKKPAPKASSAAPAGKQKTAADAPEPKRAKPMNDKAREIAERNAAPAKPSAPQARVRRTQNARNAGSKVAPAGAGAAPVQLPAIPAEAEADIASMSKHLRGQKLPETWGSGAE
jgi:ribosomal protein S20